MHYLHKVVYFNTIWAYNESYNDESNDKWLNHDGNSKVLHSQNEGSLYIKCKSSFDGMIDGCSHDKDPKFVKAQKPEHNHENCLNVQGAWFVGSSRDHLSEFEDKDFKGISVYNCCGSFILAIEK